MRFQPEQVNVNTLVGTLVEDRRQLFAAQDLTLSFQSEPLPPIQANPALLEQVITNLLTNAMNYTVEGEVTVSTARLDEDATSWITIAVEDTGLGIAAEELPNLFDRFYRGRSSEETWVPGTGLGLAISQRIAEYHGGQLTCQSEVGEGSVFTLRLPLN